MTKLRAIPANLAKHGPEIQAGLAAADRRRAELEFMANGSRNFSWKPSRPIIDAGQVQELAVSIETVHHPPAEPLQQVSKDELSLANAGSVKFWPLVGIAAARHNEGGAWRAWTLAKSLDKPGRGAIPIAKLRAYAEDLGIHPKTWRRWLSAARRLTLIRDRACGDGWIVLASHHLAAALLGCDSAGQRPASIMATDLAGEGWRALIWAGYQATLIGRPISQAKKESITGVPVSTQRAYNSQAGVKQRANYAISDRPIEHLDGMLEFENRAAPFKFWNPKKQRWEICWRLPNIVEESPAQSLSRGRSKKINKAIKRLTYQREDDSSILGRVQSFDAGNRQQALKLFHRTSRQVRATERKLIKADLRQNEQPRELYLFKRDALKSTFWIALPWVTEG